MYYEEGGAFIAFVLTQGHTHSVCDLHYRLALLLQWIDSCLLFNVTMSV